MAQTGPSVRAGERGPERSCPETAGDGNPGESSPFIGSVEVGGERAFERKSMALFEAGDPHPLSPSEQRRRHPREQTPASRCPGVWAEASGSPAEGLGLGRLGSPGALSPDR
eukprot:bmy_05112T0